MEDELERQADRERLAEESRIAKVVRLAFENTIYGKQQKAAADAELAMRERIAQEIKQQLEANRAIEEPEPLSVRDWLALSV